MTPCAPCEASLARAAPETRAPYREQNARQRQTHEQPETAPFRVQNLSQLPGVSGSGRCDRRQFGGTMQAANEPMTPTAPISCSVLRINLSISAAVDYTCCTMGGQA
jgi:hypothetical protein